MPRYDRLVNPARPWARILIPTAWHSPLLLSTVSTRAHARAPLPSAMGVCRTWFSGFSGLWHKGTKSTTTDSDSQLTHVASSCEVLGKDSQPVRPLYAVVPVKGGQDGFWVDAERFGIKRPKESDEEDTQPQQLVLKNMNDSFCEFVLPFKDHPSMLYDYVNVHGNIRVGRILEELDKLAGAVAYRHCSDQDGRVGPITIVTASVDRIELLKEITSNHNYRFSGKVCYVGISSMEIYLKVETLADASTEPKDLVLVAHFTMVAMNKAAQKSIQANPMTLLNDQQKRVFHLAEKLRQTKSLRHSQSLSKSPPSAGERKLMHDIYLETKQYQDQKFDQPRRPSDLIWMDETTLDSMNVTFPENRNVHNKIFGGYLMRLALELAYANGHLFCKGPPHLIAIDDITFKKPVPIGSLLNLSSQVTYSLGAPNTAFEVSVTADVIRPSSGTRETTNVFHLTFKPPTSAPFPRVLPRSYTDLMKYIEAHRRYEQHKDRFTLPRELIED